MRVDLARQLAPSTQVQGEKDWNQNGETTWLKMACMTFMRGFRRVNSLTYTIASLPRRHFCSAESKDEDQSHTNARDIEENSLPQGRNLELVVSCLRVDRVIASGLGMGRRFVLQ